MDNQQDISSGETNPSDSKPEATVVLKGEMIHGDKPKPSATDSPSQKATVVVQGDAADEQQPDKPRKESETTGTHSEKPAEKAPATSPAKMQLQSRLPSLDDDSDVGIEKDHVVTRDGKADLAFTGTLVASAAPSFASEGKWQEYRIYETTGGKHVFSKISRSILAEDEDGHEAEVFDPAPTSVSSQFLRSARDLARSKPVTWNDGAVDFFGYDPLAKTLYRKVSGQFEEHIS